MEIGLYRSCRSDADDGLHTVEIEELVGIDADGGHTHAVTHHADALALMSACKAKHTSNIVELYGIIEELLCHEFRTQRIARHNHCLGDVAILGPDVGSWSFCHNQ